LGYLMHLSLAFPPDWIVKVAPAEQRVAVLPAATPGANALPRAIITYGPIQLRPDEPVEWQNRMCSSDIPPGARVKRGRAIDHQTRTGWPLRLLEAVVTRGDTDEIIEARICAFFTFFEHTSMAIARASSPAALEAMGPALLEILTSGVPDWVGAAVPLASLWDLPDGTARDRHRHGPVAARAETLARVDEDLATAPTAALHVARGRLLLDSDRSQDALDAFARALALDPTIESAHYLRGVAFGNLGSHAQAIEAWSSALALTPRADTHYNIGQAHFFLKQYEPALASFRAAKALEPADFLTARKEIQCLYALGQYEAAQAAQIAFRQRWDATSDPRARFIDEYVFDQFDGDGFTVHATEVLRHSSTATQTLMVFQPFTVHGHHDHALPVAVTVETSAQAQAAGTPYVVGLRVGERYQVIGASASLPSYPDTKREVVRVLVEALKQAAH
jgi:hypothetical protein